MSLPFETVRLRAEYDLLAPDSSEIRLLAAGTRASLVHCTLPPGRTSLAVVHRTVEEVWYCLAGAGELWRRQEGRAETIALGPGLCATIPTGTHFQFRATGAEPLRLLIATMPPWPGAHEAVRVADHWPTA